MVESGDRALPELRSGVDPAFMLKLLMCTCPLSCLNGCDIEVDGTDICGEWPARGDGTFAAVRYGDPDLLADSCLILRPPRGSFSRGDN